MNIGDTLDRTTLDLPLALSGGDTTTLAAQAGHWLVLYFYPTPTKRCAAPSTSSR